MSKWWRKAKRRNGQLKLDVQANGHDKKGHSQMTTVTTNDMATTDDDATPLACSQTNDAWWKLIGRYDFYFGSVNTKATLLVVFDTFVAGSIVLKWRDIQEAFGAHHSCFILAALCLIAAALASLVSMGFAFWAVSPYLKSTNRPNDYHSLIFFGDVASYERAEEYLEHVKELQGNSLRKDLVFQAHALAGGLTAKFKWLRYSVSYIVFGQLPALALMLLILVITLAIDLLARVG